MSPLRFCCYGPCATLSVCNSCTCGGGGGGGVCVRVCIGALFTASVMYLCVRGPISLQR